MSHFLQTLFRDLRAMPRDLWVLVGGQFINRFGSFVFPFLALYLSQRGLTNGQVAAVLGSIALGQLGAPFVSGYLADAIGRRNTIVISLVGGAATLLGIYWCASYPQLIAVAMLHGFFAFMFGAPASALIADVVPPELRVTAFALLRLAINAGFAAGPAMAGVLFTRAPVWIFVGDAATTLVFALLAWTMLPHGLRTIRGRVLSPGVIARSWRLAVSDAWRNGPYLQLLVGLLLMAMAFTQVFNVLAIDATDRGMSPASYGVLMAFNGLLIMCIELPLSHWIQRFPARRVLAIGFTVVGLGCGAFAFAETMPAFLAAMALFTLGEMLSVPVTSGYSSRLAPVEYRGRYFGFNTVVWSLAGMAGSSGVWFYGQLGAAWWQWAGVLGLLASVVMLFEMHDRRELPVVIASAAAK